MRFDWEKFMDEDNKIAVLCKTQDEANDFCKKMDEHGLMWYSNISYLDETNWGNYTEDTAYTNYGAYSPIEYYRKQKNYTILEWSDYMNYFTKSDMLNGYVCELRNGEIGVWINGTVVNDNDDYTCYNDDLTDEYITNQYDIIKVSDCYGKIIWERVEEVVEDINKKKWEFKDSLDNKLRIEPNNRNAGYNYSCSDEPILINFPDEDDDGFDYCIGLSIDQAKQIISALTEIVEFVESEDK